MRAYEEFWCVLNTLLTELLKVEKRYRVDACLGQNETTFISSSISNCCGCGNMGDYSADDGYYEESGAVGYLHISSCARLWQCSRMLCDILIPAFNIPMVFSIHPLSLLFWDFYSPSSCTIESTRSYTHRNYAIMYIYMPH